MTVVKCIECDFDFDKAEIVNGLLTEEGFTCPTCLFIERNTMKEKQKKTISIGKKKAIELAESYWWQYSTDREVAEFQLSVDELCMPFSDFHKAVESALGRQVWTHEFGVANGLLDELMGERPAPTMDEIINLIPESKRIIIER